MPMTAAPVVERLGRVASRAKPAVDNVTASHMTGG